MKPTKYDIRRRLGLREVPKPPEDLARRIKAEIPASFRYHDHVSAGSKGAGPAAAPWGMSWQVAASFLALTIVGVGIYMVTWESQKMDTATTSIAEADGRESLEFAPPTAPTASPAAAPAAEAPVATMRPQEARGAKSPAAPASEAYDMAAAPPPPPPPPRARSAGSGGDAGVEGGVLGGIIGGVVDQPEDRAEKLADAKSATDRDKGFAEEKETLAKAASPAPAATSAQPGRRDAKDEQTRVTAVAQAPAMSSAGNSAAEGAAFGAITADAPLRVCCNIKPPEVIERVEIIYPKKAREARVQGIVIVEAVIDRNGNVKSVKVLKPLPMGLDEAAVTAIKQWKFKPATLEGKPVEVFYNLTVNAKLAR